MRLTVPVIAVVVALGALAGARSLGSDAPPFRPAALGTCDGFDAVGDDPVAFLARPGTWLRVRSLGAARGDTYPGRFVVAGGDGAAPAALRMSPRTADDIRAALRMRAEVAAHTAGDGSQLSYAVAYRGGEFAFLGRCAGFTLTEPVTAHLGARAGGVVAGLVGKPPAAIRVAFAPPEVTAAPRPRPARLHEGRVDPSVLKPLRDGFLRLSVPESWRGPYTVCTKIPQGWNDCVDLSSAETAAISVGMFHDPAAPTVELWLLDRDATLTRPIAHLGDVAVRGGPGATTTVTFASSPSLADVLADPSRRALLSA
ncbi:MAG TPA: hypothetical protein VF519_18965 [Mycobacteriales bacterium]